MILPSQALAEAKAALDPLELYPTPVQLDRVRIRVARWIFKIPGLRRFDGLATRRTIYLRRPPRRRDALIVHELCHIWQMQHHPVHMPLSYLWRRYDRNPYEVQAREAAQRVSR